MSVTSHAPPSSITFRHGNLNDMSRPFNDPALSKSPPTLSRLPVDHGISNYVLTPKIGSTSQRPKYLRRSEKTPCQCLMSFVALNLRPGMCRDLNGQPRTSKQHSSFDKTNKISRLHCLGEIMASYYYANVGNLSANVWE